MRNEALGLPASASPSLPPTPKAALPQSPPTVPKLSMHESIRTSQQDLDNRQREFEQSMRIAEDDEVLPEFDSLSLRENTVAKPDTVGLTATDIAGYFHSNCDLSLRLKRDTREERRGVSIPPSALTSALFTRGNEWETHLMNILRRDNLLLEFAGTSVKELLKVIKNDPRDLFYVSGLSMEPPKDLFKTHVRTLKPDFIGVRKHAKSTISLTVIDAKVSHVLKVTHQIQIALYVACLSALISSTSIVIEEDAFVWLSPLREWPSSIDSLMTPESRFSLSTVAPLLQTLLNNKIPNLLNDRLEAVEWGVGARCEGCEFEPGCVARAKVTGDVSLVGGTRGNDRMALQRIVSRFRTMNRTGHTSTQLGGLDLVVVGKWNAFWGDELERKEAGGLSKLKYGRSDIEDLRAAILSPGFNTELLRDSPSIAQAGYKLLSIDRMSVRNDSPVLKSAINNTIEPLGRPCFTFPPSEDHAVFFSVLKDPETDATVGISLLHTISPNQTELYHKTFLGPTLCSDFITALSTRIRHLLSLTPTPCVQFYIFSQTEHQTLMTALLESFHPPSTRTDAQLCITTLLDHPSVLLTPFLPPLLMTKQHLLGSLSSKRKLDLQWYLRLLEHTDSVPVGTVDTLKAGIAAVVEDGVAVAWVPRVVVVEKVVKGTVAVPVSRVTLESCARLLWVDGEEVESADEVYVSWKRGKLRDVEEALRRRARAVGGICCGIRECIAREFRVEKVLVNELAPFAVVELDICKDPVLSRLLFQTQFEMIKTFQSIKESRFDTFSACELAYLGPGPPKTYTHDFEIRSGHLTLQSKLNTSDPTRSFFDWILIDATVSREVAPLFNDLRFMNASIISVEFSTQEKREYGAHLAFAEIKQMETLNVVRLGVKVSGGCGFTFMNKTFHLFPRFIDFNTQKVVHGLMNCEIERVKRVEAGGGAVPPMFLRMMKESSGEWKADSADLFCVEEETLFQRDRDTHLHLLASQRSALQGMCRNVLTLVWGPPGNGKTHTLAVSTIRLMEISQRLGKRCRVLMTAFTHAAIDAFVGKVRRLLGVDGCGVSGVSVVNLGDKGAKVGEEEVSVTVGTVWAISKLMEKPNTKGSFDALIVDEGSQFLLSYGAIAFQAIDGPDASSKRVVIAGDHMQLGPILKQEYPTPSSTRPIFGSILESLLFQNKPCTHMLTENFRFVTPLCNFAQTLYPSTQHFTPFNASQPMLQLGLSTALKQSPHPPLLHTLLPALLRTPLLTIQLQTPPNVTLEFHLRQESLLVSQLVLTFHTALPTARIFVITPHRMQRTLLTTTLQTHTQNTPATLLRIDTVERMQGDESDIVIACYGFTGHFETLEKEVDFVFNVRRVNVALSRAKAGCVLVAGRGLFEPPVGVLGGEMGRRGVEHFRRFRERSEVIDYPFK
ncbi:Tripartite DNA replication factor [Podochytrium sp. JEL0797]|nr:Tripartite DNA replication factor [Podochytrium sp. JEL0797]